MSRAVTGGAYLQQPGAVVQVRLAALKSFPVVTHDRGQSLPQIRDDRFTLAAAAIPFW